MFTTGSLSRPSVAQWGFDELINRRIKVLQTSPLPLGYRALAGLPLEVLSLQTAVANPE
jgi:hypothetical protein